MCRRLTGQQDLVPCDGVVPPSFKFSQSSTRVAPPSCAAIADVTELAQTSSDTRWSFLRFVFSGSRFGLPGSGLHSHQPNHYGLSPAPELHAPIPEPLFIITLYPVSTNPVAWRHIPRMKSRLDSISAIFAFFIDGQKAYLDIFSGFGFLFDDAVNGFFTGILG
jgi:hypothetical protein